MFISLAGNYLRPSNNSRPLNFNINAVVLIVITYLDLRKWSNVYLNLSIFTLFLKNKNIIFKIRRSKVTDYAALTTHISRVLISWQFVQLACTRSSVTMASCNESVVIVGDLRIPT